MYMVCMYIAVPIHRPTDILNLLKVVFQRRILTIFLFIFSTISKALSTARLHTINI